jgi:hypothetical protein
MDHRTFLKTLVIGVAGMKVTSLAKRSAQEVDESPFLDVRRLGARGDGRTNDLAALSAAGEIAAATGRWLVLPAGVYRIDGPLRWSNVPGIVGIPDRSIIRSTLHGGRALTIDTTVDAIGVPSASFVVGLSLDGSAGQAAIGMDLGSGPLAGRITLSDCVVRGFAAPGAVGLRVRAVVQGVLERLLVTRNSTNVLIEGPTPAFPTTVTFEGCNIRESLGAGLVVRGGYALRFRNCIFESNGEEGVLIAPFQGRTVLMCSIEDAWFENNARRKSTAFDCDADGSAPSSTCNPLLVRCLFTTQRSRSLRLHSATNFLVDSCRFPQANGCVVVEGAASHGTFTNFQRFAGDFASLVSVAPDVRNITHTR